MCFVANADNTMDDYARGANVFFDVQKSANGLTLIGKENGTEVFKRMISNASFSSFSSFNRGSFQVQRLQNDLVS